MADLGSTSYSETDASNNASPPNGWPEGMNPSDVNNSARANMGAEKRWWDRSNSTLTTAGTSTAYTLTYTMAAAAYYDGEEFSFIANATCGAAPTININGLGARNLRKFTAGAYANLAAADIVTNQPVRVRYNLASTAFDVLFSAFIASGLATTGANTFTGVQTMSGFAINEAQGTAIASAGTTDIGAALGNYVHITGTTTITALGTIQAGTRRKVVFDGILTLTHNATSLINLSGANITTAAGDAAEFESEGSGNWRMTSYERKDGTALIVSTGVAVPSITTTATNPVGTTQTPADNTIPQITEGNPVTAFTSVSYTALNAAHRVRVQVIGTVTSSAAADVACVALFLDGGANAVAVQFVSAPNGLPFPFILSYEAVQSAGAHTYTVRMGTNASGSVIINGANGQQYGNGTHLCQLIIQELNAP